MNYCYSNPIFGSNATNTTNSFGVNNDMISSYGHWPPIYKSSNGVESHGNRQMNPVGSSHDRRHGFIPPNSHYMSTNSREPTFPTYPAYGTSNWSPSTTQSYGPTYTVANQPLMTNTTSSQLIPTSSPVSAVYVPSSINRAESMTDSTNQCNDGKEEFKLLINHLENIRKSNEKYQNNLLNELRQLREVMIDLKCLTSDLPNRFSDALTNSLASVRSRSNSVSIDSDGEMIEILDKIDITKSDEYGETNSNTSNRMDLSQWQKIENNSSFKDSVREKSNGIKSSTVDKFVFPYDSTIDMSIWLKKD